MDFSGNYFKKIETAFYGLAIVLPRRDCGVSSYIKDFHLFQAIKQWLDYISEKNVTG